MSGELQTDDLLPDDLVWEDAHLSDVAVTTFGDGQDALLPAAARDHAATCAACAARIGGAALFSAALDAAAQGAMTPAVSAEAETTASARPARAHLPWRWIAAAVVLAFVGAIPMLADARGDVARFVHLAIRTAPTFAHGAAAGARDVLASGVWATTTIAVGLAMVALGVALVRALPRPAGNG